MALSLNDTKGLNLGFIEGEIYKNGTMKCTKCVENSYLDNYVTYTYQGPNFYCTVIVWGFYTD